MIANKKTIILGIDPGTHRLGYGIIEANGRKLTPITYGVIETKAKHSADQLYATHIALKKIIDEYHPDVCGVEKLFFSKNQKTALSVSEAKGVILMTVAQAGISVFEMAPNEVKQTISGYGQADKKAVLKMVQLILGIKNFTSIDDASDALAIAIATSFLA